MHCSDLKESSAGILKKLIYIFDPKNSISPKRFLQILIVTAKPMFTHYLLKSVKFFALCLETETDLKKNP